MFLRVIREFDPGISIGFEARINEIVNNNLTVEYEKNRIYKLQVGVESGYESGLEKIRKKITLSEVFSFAESSSNKSFSSNIVWSFIVGFPWENYDNIKNYY